MKQKIVLFVGAVALLTATVAPQPSYAMTEEEKKKLAGALIGIAIAKKIKEKQEDKKAVGEPYIAAKDVRCFPEVEKCYWKGIYTRKWTEREFWN